MQDVLRIYIKIPRRFFAGKNLKGIFIGKYYEVRTVWALSVQIPADKAEARGLASVYI